MCLKSELLIQYTIKESPSHASALFFSLPTVPIGIENKIDNEFEKIWTGCYILKPFSQWRHLILFFFEVQYVTPQARSISPKWGWGGRLGFRSFEQLNFISQMWSLEVMFSRCLVLPLLNTHDKGNPYRHHSQRQCPFHYQPPKTISSKFKETNQTSVCFTLGFVNLLSNYMILDNWCLKRQNFG